MNEELKKEIRKMALQNAFEHGGETRDKIILGKILGTKPEFRTKVKEISKDISEIVSNVNQLSSEEQKKEIDDNFPEILAPKEKIQEREGLTRIKKCNPRKCDYKVSSRTKWLSTHRTCKSCNNQFRICKNVRR